MKSVIITGATRGIGLALARFYADKGYCLMLNGGHNEEALAAVEKELSTKTHPHQYSVGRQLAGA